MKKIFISDIYEGSIDNLLCWVSNKRIIGKRAFLDIYDSSGEIEATASQDQCDDYDAIIHVNRESAVSIGGTLREDGKIYIKSFRIIAKADNVISPSPNQKHYSPFLPCYASHIIEHPALYIRNQKLRTSYLIMACFKREIQKYYWEHGFIEFDAPTLTRQTLYDDDGAVWIAGDYPDVCLSRCATFHLEPAVVAYEKVFTITDSHADEQVKDKRHLIEFSHLKAEICWVTLEELVEFAGKMLYQISINLYHTESERIELLISKVEFEKKLDNMRPENHKMITYDEACAILEELGEPLEYGKSLSSRHEEYLTHYFGDVFLWVKHIPATVEGFMFKRLPENPFLTRTCDLVAPYGFGEILGCAEKICDAEELLNSMKSKGKDSCGDRYDDYILLHRYGLPPHGGIGMGIERVVRYLLNLDHVKYVRPFPIIKGTQIRH